MQQENNLSIVSQAVKDTEFYNLANEDIDISIPSYRPADAQSENGIYEFLFKKFAQKIEKVAPAKIVSYDRQKNRATVQILVQNITSVGGKLDKKPLSNIPVFIFGGGSFGQSFPLKENDLGFIIAADRDISVFKQLLSVFAPATYECHQYKDGFFIPIIINGFTVSADDSEAVVLSSLDGMTKFTLSSGKITISAENIVLNGKTRVEGEFSAQTIKADNGVSGTFTNSVTSTDGIVTGGS